jgi:asparagine synthase (glutamine-hydrolysing)
LRKAVEDLLPEDVLWRKKSPYPKTFHPNYKKIVGERLQDAISDPNAPLLRLVKKSALEELIQSNRPDPFYGQLMTTPQTIAYFLQIHYWLNEYKVEIA